MTKRKFIEVIVPELDKNKKSMGLNRMYMKNRFINGSNAQIWVTEQVDYIYSCCGNDWPYQILVNGARVQRKYVSLEF